VALGSRVYFAADDGVTGHELWSSDGTDQGTWQVVDIDPAGSSGPTGLVRRGNLLHFTATTPAAGLEPWRSDGTAAGTFLLGDLWPGPVSSYPLGRYGWGCPVDWMNVHGQLVFSAVDPVAGRELWRSDGTPAGTVRIQDTRPGPEGTLPLDAAELVPDGPLLVATGNDATGQELWRTDGGDADTVLLHDIAPGPDSSSPAWLAASGGYVFFRADDGQSGGELWAVPRADPGVVGNSLRLVKAAGGQVTLAWDPSCVPFDPDYALYRGTLGGLWDHARATCSTAGARTWTEPEPAASAYWLVAPRNRLAEGSYGRDASGNEVPAAAAACAPQRLGACP
jgi:ELWxxDGT repeat protein